MSADFGELERLAELVERSGIGELTLREGDRRITIRRRGGASVAASPAGLSPLVSAVEDEEIEAEESVSEGEWGPETVWITAPLVGFFRQADPAVSLGARVLAGERVGAIECMKIVSEILAEYEGIVTEVLAEDGMPVEYGQPLFAVER